MKVILVFLLVVSLFACVECSFLGKKFKQVSNAVGTLLGSKFGSRASKDINNAFTNLQNININAKGDLFVHTPELLQAMTTFSAALQTAKIGADEDTLHKIDNILTVFSEVSEDITLAVTKASENFGVNSVVLANEGIDRALDKFSLISDNLGANFGSYSADVFQDTVGFTLQIMDKWFTSIFSDGFNLALLAMVFMFIHLVLSISTSEKVGSFGKVVLIGALVVCSVSIFLPTTFGSILRPSQESIPVTNTRNTVHPIPDNFTCNLKVGQLLNDVEELKKSLQSFAKLNEKLETRLKETHDQQREQEKRIQVLSTEQVEAKKSVMSGLSSAINIATARYIFPTLPEGALSATSEHKGGGHLVSRGKLNDPTGKNDNNGRHMQCWIRGESTSDHENMQVDLGKLYYITEIHTSGRGHDDQHIQQYKVSFNDPVDRHIRGLANIDNSDVFDGNYAGTSVSINKSFKPFVAQYVKIHPTKWKGNMCLRWDIVGVALEDMKLGIDDQQFLLTA